jgi:hypothetical protein
LLLDELLAPPDPRSTPTLTVRPLLVLLVLPDALLDPPAPRSAPALTLRLVPELLVLPDELLDPFVPVSTLAFTFRVAEAPGSRAHDEIVRVEGEVTRETNRAGGIEGGMSNGQPLRVRAAMKPISTLMQPLKTIDMSTGEPDQAVRERSDVCAVPAAAVVGEQMVAFTLASEFSRKFGGDTAEELSQSVAGYRGRIDLRLGG